MTMDENPRGMDKGGMGVWVRETAGLKGCVECGLGIGSKSVLRMGCVIDGVHYGS